jgi:hypothetical protein
MEESGNWSRQRRWRRPRALGTAMAAVIMVIVIAVVGASAYFAFKGSTSAGGSSSKSIANCWPPSSPICSTVSGGHDVLMSEPFRVSSQQTPIPFTAAYTGSGTVQWYNFTFGDGTFKNQTTPTTAHSYAFPGTYLASVQAFVGGSWHDNYNGLLLVQVSPGTGLASSNEVPLVRGLVTANGTTGATNPSGVIAGSASVTVNGSYSSNPTDPLATPIAPTLTVSSGGTLSGVTAGSTYVAGSATFSHSGTFWIVMNGGSTVGATTYTQNYIWTIFVAASGTHAGYVLAGAGSATGGGVGGSKVYSSPHTGTLDIYEYTGSGGNSLDPAIDYETVGYEPILNLYETLISYNQSETGPTEAETR